MDWTEKHRPTSLSEIRGNDKARDALREWAESWEDHQEAVILHGSPGVGKTSSAHALAADMDWPTIELNASDSRTKDVVEQVAGEAAKSGTLSAGGSGRRLVILDEADNLHGNVDYGGSRAITELVGEADQPMILIANEYYEMSTALRNKCREVEFRDVSKRSIVPVLRDVCRQEDVAFEEEALERIAEMNSGDLRGAIKDLQALAGGRDEIVADDVVTGERDTTAGIFDFLDTLIKEADAETALKASYDVDETPDDLINWIEDNVPKDYHGEELARAYDFLARADRWLGVVRATQDYTFWRYAADDMTAGVAAARREPKGGWTRYGPPSYRSKLGRSRSTRDKRDYVARHVAESAGVSMGTARREVLPYLSSMTHHCKNRDLTVAMAARYDLEPEHVAFVTGSGEDTNKVQSIVEDARELQEAAAVEHSDGAFDGAVSDSGASGEGEDAAAGDDAGATEDTSATARTAADDGGEAATGSPTGSRTGGTDKDGGTGNDGRTGNDGGTGDTAAAGAGDTDERTDQSDEQQSGLGDFV